MKKFVIWLSIWLSIGWLASPSRGESVPKTMGKASQSHPSSGQEAYLQYEMQEAANIKLWQDTKLWNDVELWHKAEADNAADLKRKAQPVKVNRGTTRTVIAVTGDDIWSKLGACESGNNPTSVSANGLYKGAFQFVDATWQSLGYSGRASDHSYAEQLEGAKRLQARSGWSQWPRCAHRLGLI
jgi:hypothetical protein